MKNYYEYLEFNGASLFTVICLPEGEGAFPTIIRRDPYVDADEFRPEDEIVATFAASVEDWTAHGYAVVYQHCRGRGKSTGVQWVISSPSASQNSASAMKSVPSQIAVSTLRPEVSTFTASEYAVPASQGINSGKRSVTGIHLPPT